MKRTHRWAVIVTALVLAAGSTLVPSAARALQRLPDQPKQGWLPYEYFGDPGEPGGSKATRLNMRVIRMGSGYFFIVERSPRGVQSRTASPIQRPAERAR